MITLDELCDQLEARYSHPVYDLSDLHLVRPGVSDVAVRAAERRLTLELPRSFTTVVTRFDFSRLNIANIAFQYGPGLQRFVDANLNLSSDDSFKALFSQTAVLVGTTDGHFLRMLVTNGRILATEKFAAGAKGDETVAGDFEEFVTMAGSIALGRSKSQRLETALALHASAFWLQLASGSA